MLQEVTAAAAVTAACVAVGLAGNGWTPAFLSKAIVRWTPAFASAPAVATDTNIATGGDVT